MATSMGYQQAAPPQIGAVRIIPPTTAPTSTKSPRGASSLNFIRLSVLQGIRQLHTTPIKLPKGATAFFTVQRSRAATATVTAPSSGSQTTEYSQSSTTFPATKPMAPQTAMRQAL